LHKALKFISNITILLTVLTVSYLVSYVRSKIRRCYYFQMPALTPLHRPISSQDIERTVCDAEQ